MSKFIDIHTHKVTDNKESIEVLVIDTKKTKYKIPKSKSFCFGIHPWYIQNYSLDYIEKELNNFKILPNFFALGEIGLDKSSNIDYELQKKYFEFQIDFAVRENINCIVIHSVKSYSEILEILKKKNYKQKIILHGFNSTIEMAQSFLKYDCFFSFGEMLFKNTKALQVFNQLPLENIFLETDDQSEYSIELIYQKAALLKKLDVSELKEILYQSFIKKFNIVSH